MDLVSEAYGLIIDGEKKKTDWIKSKEKSGLLTEKRSKG